MTTKQPSKKTAAASAFQGITPRSIGYVPTRALGWSPTPTVEQKLKSIAKEFDDTKARASQEAQVALREVQRLEIATALAKEKARKALVVWRKIERLTIMEAPPKKAPDTPPDAKPAESRTEDARGQKRKAPPEEAPADAEPAAKRKKKPLRRWKTDVLKELKECGAKIDRSLDSAAFFDELCKIFPNHGRNRKSIIRKARSLGIRPDCEETEEDNNSGTETL